MDIRREADQLISMVALALKLDLDQTAFDAELGDVWRLDVDALRKQFADTNERASREREAFIAVYNSIVEYLRLDLLPENADDFIAELDNSISKAEEMENTARAKIRQFDRVSQGAISAARRQGRTDLLPILASHRSNAFEHWETMRKVAHDLRWVLMEERALHEPAPSGATKQGSNTDLAAYLKSLS